MARPRWRSDNSFFCPLSTKKPQKSRQTRARTDINLPAARTHDASRRPIEHTEKKKKEDASDRIENCGASSSSSGAGEAWASTQHALPGTIGNHRDREAVFFGSDQEQEPRGTKCDLLEEPRVVMLNCWLLILRRRSADSNQYAPQLSQSKPLRAFVSSIRIELPSLHSRARNSRNRPMPLPPWLHPPHLLRHPQTRDVKRALIEICKRRPPVGTMVDGWSGKGGPDSIEERCHQRATTGGKEPNGLILRYSPFPLCSTLSSAGYRVDLTAPASTTSRYPPEDDPRCASSTAGAYQGCPQTTAAAAIASRAHQS